MVQRAKGTMVDSIPLPPRLDAVTAPELISQLLDRSSDGDVLLDASRTSYVGALGAQVLLSAQRMAQANDASFDILGMQDGVNEQLLSMGLAELTQPEEDT